MRATYLETNKGLDHLKEKCLHFQALQPPQGQRSTYALAQAGAQPVALEHVADAATCL